MARDRRPSLPLPARYAHRPWPVRALAFGFLFVLWLVALWWLTRMPPLPPLPEEAQRYEDCTVDPTNDGCGVWPR